MPEMKDRIDSIIKYSGLTNAKFAEKIGVSASLISHLTSGRQQPNYETISKIFEAFPELNVEWFFGKKVNMLKNNETIKNEINLFSNTKRKPSKIIELEENDDDDENKIIIEKPTVETIAVKPQKPEIPLTSNFIEQEKKIEIKENLNIIEEPTVENKKNITKEKQLEKIIFFYSDKSFEIYINSVCP